MDPTPFFISAVAAGFVLVGVVAYSYVRPQREHKPSVTALLGILGFTLIAIPNFTSISVRGSNIELSLIREMQARQLEALVSEEAPAEARLPMRRRLAPPVPAAADSEDARPSVTPVGDSGDSVETASPEEHTKLLISAFDRGLLELSTLSNAELLSLNEHVTRRGRNSGIEARASE